jgi:hypothetical protein
MRNLEHETQQSILGILGMPAWLPFETVIDYRQHHLTLVRLDSAGHRLASVPLQVADSVMLIQTPDSEHYGVHATVGDSLIDLMIDTGAESDLLGGVARARLQSYLVAAGHDSAFDAPRVRIEHLTVGANTYALPFVCQPGADLLGYPFLNRLGVVGFNFRATKLYVYR